ncbi:MAG: F0F1 ATP synthase subunit gamma [Alphaproteobacteria bacterium]|nr:F0F1 ATP synthase subunit gamma [Alphaproteobacteria bacterium]
MATLKDLRVRITSVKSTQKITSAMKMVAASKLRRAQTQAEAARPYAQRMERMLASLGASVAGSPTAPKLLAGTGGDKVHLLVPVTGERGLAGAFNSNVGRLTRNLARKLESEGKTVKILAVGRKGRDYLRREIGSRLIGDISFAGKKTIGFAEAQEIAARITQLLDDGAFDVCTVVYNRFQSVISQIPTEMRLIPAPLPAEGSASAGGAIYEYEAGDPDEPDQEVILAKLLPQNLAIQIYRALLENSAGFYGAQMTSMDNATRNAGDMIKRLTLNYNRARQANITKELIEIISGAEAV